jgi:hypothetical protein
MSAVRANGQRLPWSIIVIGGLGLAGLAAGYAMADANGEDNRWGASLALGILGLLAALWLVLAWGSNQPFRLRRRVPFAAADVRQHAVWWFGGAPWVLSRDDGYELVFWRRTEPILGVVLILLLFGVVPGILYYFWARGTQTVAIAFADVENGADIEILVDPQGATGRSTVVRFYNSLHALAD